jgi:hypothetical protein
MQQQSLCMCHHDRAGSNAATTEQSGGSGMRQCNMSGFTTKDGQPLAATNAGHSKHLWRRQLHQQFAVLLIT